MCQNEGGGGEEIDEVEGHVSVNMDPTNWNKLNEIIGVYFPGSAMIVDGDGSDGGVASVKTELAEAIKNTIKGSITFKICPCFKKRYAFL